MGKNASTIFFVFLGAAVGYYFGSEWRAQGWDLIYEIGQGAAVGFSFSIAFSQKEFGMLVGATVGLVVAMSLDWIAGSTIDMKNKLSFMALCAFVAWGYRWGWAYWKPVLITGLIGVLIGFVWGLNQRHFFGEICLPVGFLNASLLSVQMSMIGMAFGSLYIKFFR